MPRYTAAHWGVYEIEDKDTLRPIASDPAPSRIGRGWVSAARDPGTRILSPAIRKGWLEGDHGAARSDDAYVEVTWDEAIAHAARALKTVRDSHGNQAIYAGSYGWASAGRLHHAQSQMRRFLNLIGGFTSKRETYSHGAAEVLWPHVTGLTNDQMQQQMPSWPLILRHASLVVAFGGISARTAQINSGGTSTHGLPAVLGELGAKTLNISPQRSDLAGAEWLPIRPGTDTALILGLCHTLLVENLADQAFLTRYTSGWPEFRAYLDGADGVEKSAHWAAPICDINAETIRELARKMSREQTLIAMSWGLQRADHGEMPIWSGLALAAMLGQIGQPGLGYAFGLGCVSSVGQPSRQDRRWPGIPATPNPVTDFIPVARITDMLEGPGTSYRYNLQTRTYPEIKLVYWTGGNPFHHHQDLNRLDAAWRNPQTVIVQDHSWTATARRADIVLPCTTPLEREDIMMHRSDPSLFSMQPMAKPMGNALNDQEIFRRLAAAFGQEEAFTDGRSEEGWLRWMWDRMQDREPGLPQFDAFREMGRFDLPNSDASYTLFEAFIADPDANPLATESGRITLFNTAIAQAGLPDMPGHPAFFPAFETLTQAPDGALHLISPQPDTRLHAQNDWGTEAQADKIDGREPCALHPDTAAARGITDGMVVKLWNSRGATLAGARLTRDIRPDCIALATGAWYDPMKIDGETIDLAGNPNVLTRDVGCSELSQSNSAHTALVFVEPWSGHAPKPRTGRPPRFVD